MKFTNKITLEKVKVYKAYKGDIDFWARGGSKKEKSIMRDQDWYLIDKLMQNIKLVNDNLASPEFEKEIIDQLIICCDSAQTINELKILQKQL